MIDILTESECETMIMKKIEKYVQQIKNPSDKEGHTGDLMDKNDVKPYEFNIQYSTVKGWENADLCDDPEYVRIMYGKKKKEEEFDLWGD